MIGELTVMDDEMNEMPVGEPGTLWFKPASEFNYHKEPEKTAEAYSADKSLTTVGDVGYLDEDGFLYLTDRKAFMIISGGVNIYLKNVKTSLYLTQKFLMLPFLVFQIKI